MRRASRSSSSTEHRIELNSLGGASRPSRASCPRRRSSPRQSSGDPEVSGSTARLVLLILVIVFASMQILSIGGLLFVGIVLVALFVLGFIILELMQDLRSFFDYFALRHRVIQRVRQADPVVYVPEGKDAVHRILSHLAATSPDVRGLMAVPGAVAIPALLTGKSGLTYSFDAYVRRSPSQLWRFTSLGSPGYAVFVKAFERAPTLQDLNALKAAVEDASMASRIPPART